MQNREENKTRTCHMCGLPSYSLSTGGVLTKLHIKATNGFRRDRRITVWCCTESCALQSRAVAQMGAATHKWPMTLAEFASLERSKRDKTYSETRMNTGAVEGDFSELSLPHTEPENGTKPRLGGRPRKYVSTVERKRAYRQRLKATNGLPN